MAVEITIMKDVDFSKISRRLVKLAGATLSKIAWTYVEETKRNIQRKRLFRSRTGNLLQSIIAVPESDTRVVIFGAGTEDSFLEYGKYLEFGTKPHVIKPRERKALKIPTSNGFIFRKKVHHPGIRARHYFFGNYEEKMKTAVEAGRLYFLSKLGEVSND
jgi:hypothetical protein